MTTTKNTSEANVTDLTKTYGNKVLSIVLIVINYILLNFYLYTGYIASNQMNIIQLNLKKYLFFSILAYVIFYRQGYKKLSFWILIFVLILYAIAHIEYQFLSQFKYQI